MGDRDDEFPLFLSAALALSLGAHLVAGILLHAVPVEAVLRELASVDIEVVEEELHTVEELPPEPEPEPPPVAPAPRPAPVAEEEPEPEPEEPPVTFDNVTLTNTDGDATFVVPASSGIETEAPQPRVVPTATPSTRTGSAGGVPGGQGQGPPIVAVENLSRRPEPPSSLGELLTRYYPESCRRQGIEGSARVRLRIAPDGRASVLRTMSASRPEFATACSTMLRTTRWRPPLDRGGQPVATVVHFDCRFEVQW